MTLRKQLLKNLEELSRTAKGRSALLLQNTMTALQNSKVLPLPPDSLASRIQVLLTESDEPLTSRQIADHMGEIMWVAADPRELAGYLKSMERRGILESTLIPNPSPNSHRKNVLAWSLTSTSQKPPDLVQVRWFRVQQETFCPEPVMVTAESHEAAAQKWAEELDLGSQVTEGTEVVWTVVQRVDERVGRYVDVILTRGWNYCGHDVGEVEDL